MIVITLDDGVTYTEDGLDGGSMYLLSAKIQAAQSYSASLSRRIKAAHKKRRNDAKAGKLVMRLGPMWLESDGTLRTDVAEQVAKAFEWYCSGLGKSAIAKRLRDSGVPHLAKCSAMVVGGWLKNRAAIGEWETQDDGIIPNVYPPIIDPVLFHRAQLHTANVTKVVVKKTARDFLVGLISCASCGTSFVMQSLHGMPNSLRCRSRTVLKTCDTSVCIPKHVMEEVYKRTSEAALRQAVAQMSSTDAEQQVIQLELKILEVTTRIKKLAQAIALVDDVAELAEAIAEARTERLELEGKIALTKAGNVAPAASGWLTQGAIWKLEKEDEQTLSALLQRVGYRLSVHADGSITCSHSSTVFQYCGWDRLYNASR